VRFVAFLVTEYDEVFLGYQLGQMVEWWENQCFEDHLCPRPQGASLVMVLVLPYQQAVSNKISRLLTKYNIKTVHIPKKEKRQLLGTVKTDLRLKIPGVYHIPCECGKVYIG
jgi:hypothetical protein